MILPGALVTYFISSGMDTTFLLPFAAGNFIYIAASDLIPEVKHEKRLGKNLIHFAAFACGVLAILTYQIDFRDIGRASSKCRYRAYLGG
jgi:zinc and cadmium transporter